MNSTKMETHDCFFKLPVNPLHVQNEIVSFLQGPDGLQGIQGPPGLPGLEVQTINIAFKSCLVRSFSVLGMSVYINTIYVTD